MMFKVSDEIGYAINPAAHIDENKSTIHANVEFNIALPLYFNVRFSKIRRMIGNYDQIIQEMFSTNKGFVVGRSMTYDKTAYESKANYSTGFAGDSIVVYTIQTRNLPINKLASYCFSAQTPQNSFVRVPYIDYILIGPDTQNISMDEIFTL